MKPPPGPPATTGVLFPELLGAPEPAPPVRPRGSRVLKTVARMILWSLIAVGALRGLLPVPAGPIPAGARPTASDPAATAHHPDQRAEAVAAAFMREYLTVGEDPAARAQRLGRFTLAGLDLRRSVLLPAGATQYADQVTASGSRAVGGGIEVTVLAHLLQIRSGAYHDAGIVAFAVPLVVRREGVAVSGRPRPTALPLATGLPLGRPRTAPPELSKAAGRVARQAVVALVVSDTAALARLGGARAPTTYPLPTGWRATAVGDPEVAGPPDDLTAEVPVRARPPKGQASYLVPVHVRLRTGPKGLTVRRVDGDGSA